jgi:F-type H+-transporting ATPase subunit b
VIIHHAVIRRWAIFLGGLCAVPLTALFAWAAEDEASWRGTYDVIMMWINFSILAFLLFKYARVPLMDLLKGEVKKTAATLERAQNDKQQIDQKVKDALMALEEGRQRLRAVQEKIISEGERQRQQLIESAQHESRLMLERARVKIDHEIFQAREKLKSEFVDRAVEAVLDRLPSEITPEEQAKLIDRFIQESLAR